VALIGWRLGALLAAQAAGESKIFSMLALIGPAAVGKAYLREVRALSALVSDVTQDTDPLDDIPDPLPTGTIEIAGFALTPETVGDLEQADLLKLSRKPAEQVLILGRRSPAETKLASHLQQLGCTVDQQTLPGYAEMEWNSSLAKLPENAFAGLVSWLQTAAPSPSPLPAAQSAMKPADQPTLRDEDWREQPVQFGADERLFGILCTPHGSTPSKTVLLVNHGSNHHIGWARMHVDLARAFARKGIASLRIDIAGLGDSPAASGQPENQLYRIESTRDVSAAIDWLDRNGYRRCIVIGHCAGAYLGFHSAVSDKRIAGLVMLNLQRFFWGPNYSLAVAMSKGHRATGWYMDMLWNPTIWRRLLRREINVSSILATLTLRMLNRARANLAGLLGLLRGQESENHKVMRWFREMSRRGTRVLLVYSPQDPGLDELHLRTGPNARKLTRLPGVDIRFIEGADHNLTPLWARRRYEKLLLDYLNDQV
jgi:pimeloyl-ACP methyl ester carboxylesterase